MGKSPQRCERSQAPRLSHWVGFGVAHLGRIIPSFPGGLGYSDLLKHEKSCGRLTDRDGL